MNPRWMKKIRPLVGVLLCAVAALIASLVFEARPYRVFVPLGFVLVVLALAARYGMAVSVYGSLIAALIFARFLYHPIGSLRVDSEAARANLGWMVLGGIALSYLLLTPKELGPPKKH
jgi:K+-sensing histidine kinase KdpD